MLLTFELNRNHPKVDVYFDEEGLDFLIKKLGQIKKTRGHDHFMTESWAGNELSKINQANDSTLIHQVDFQFVPNERIKK